jgi:tetratricopeptide (TPR) repeat protein
MANLYERRNDARSALFHYEKAIVVAREAYGTYSTTVASIQADLSSMMLVTGDATGCERNAKAATIIFSKIPEEKLAQNPEFELKIALACSNLAAVYSQINEPETQRLLNITLKILERVVGRKDIRWMGASYKLVDSFVYSNKQEEAYQVLEVVKAQVDVTTPKILYDTYLGEYLYNLGTCQRHFGQYLLAHETFAKAIPVFEGLDMWGNVCWCLGQIAHTFLDEGKVKDAMDTLAVMEETIKTRNVTYPQIQQFVVEVKRHIADFKLTDRKHEEITEYEKVNDDLHKEFFLGNLQRGKVYSSELQEQADLTQFLKRKFHEDERVRNAIMYRQMTDADYDELVMHMKQMDPEGTTEEFLENMKEVRKSPRGQQDLLSELETIRRMNMYEKNPEIWKAEMEKDEYEAEIEEKLEQRNQKKHLEKEDVVQILKKKTDVLRKALAKKNKKK